MTEKEIVRRVYKAYRAAGMTDAGIWGMLGNAMCESTLCPYRLQNDYSDGYQKSLDYTRQVDSGAISGYDFVYKGPGGGGYGFFQWTLDSRKAGYIDEARRRGCSIGDMQLAIDYSLRELKDDPYFRSEVWTILSTTNDYVEASDVVCRVYENPQDKNYGDRREAAKRLIRKYADIIDGEDEPEPDEPEKPDEPDTDDEGIPIPKTWPPRTIDEHCSGWPEVWMLQSLLRCHGYNVLDDGIWGSVLTDKVKKFQTENGLEADGVVGKNTYIKLGIDPAVFERR
jgi:peptidoglycan hydrolase-like protein with peptidoglycan-binding domain